MSAAERDAFTDLDDYTSGAMSDGDAADFEEALFAAAARGEAPELTTHDQLVELALHVIGRMGFEVGSTRERVAALRSELSVHYVDLAPGAPTRIPPLPAGTQLFAYRLAVDLRGYDQVDVELATPDGKPIKTFRDVTYDPSDGALYGLCEPPLAELSFRSGPVVAKVMAAREGKPPELVSTFETSPA